MSIMHFYITKKTENSILKELDKKLTMGKKSSKPSKIYLSTLNMKTAIIHNKNHVYDCVELHEITDKTYSFKSKENNQFYSSAPVSSPDTLTPFTATVEQAQAGEHFDLCKHKRIVLSDEVLNSLMTISE